MTDDTVTPVDMDSDQDAFEAEFFSAATQVADEAKPEDEPEVDDSGEDENDPPAPEDEDEEETPEDQDEDEEEEPEEEPQPKRKNKSSLQERINELKANERIANERAESLRRELDMLKAAVEKSTPKEEVKPDVPAGAPDPDALDEDGLPLYPLGELDKNYVRDLTQFLVKEQLEEARQQALAEEEQRQFQQAQQEIAQSWAQKVEAYEEQAPEFRDNLRHLADTFKDIEGPYGEYLATTIMTSDFGPQIMDYLSQNIGEAKKIVSSGAAAATLAIGRLEARFEWMANKDEQKSNKKVSNAPAPPDTRNRGTGGQFAVRPDTDNQEAFEKEFFK